MDPSTTPPTPLAGISTDDLPELFAGGRPPDPARLGALAGDFLAFTVAPGVDAGLMEVHRRLRPWRGKRLDGDGAGDNRLAGWAARVGALALRGPGWRRDDEEPGGLPFAVSLGPSPTLPGLEVLRVDYAVAANPWPVRRFLDELVALDRDLLLGQALVRAPGGLRRWAWFCLWEEAPAGAPGDVAEASAGPGAPAP
jgi:hypothetical protein